MSKKANHLQKDIENDCCEGITVLLDELLSVHEVCNLDVIYRYKLHNLFKCRPLEMTIRATLLQG